MLRSISKIKNNNPLPHNLSWESRNYRLRTRIKLWKKEIEKAKKSIANYQKCLDKDAERLAEHEPKKPIRKPRPWTIKNPVS